MRSVLRVVVVVSSTSGGDRTEPHGVRLEIGRDRTRENVRLGSETAERAYFFFDFDGDVVLRRPGAPREPIGVGGVRDVLVRRFQARDLIGRASRYRHSRADRRDRRPHDDRPLNFNFGGRARRRRDARVRRDGIADARSVAFSDGRRESIRARIRRRAVPERSRGPLERVRRRKGPRTRLPRLVPSTGTAPLEDAERAQRHRRRDQAHEHPEALARRARPRPPPRTLRRTRGGHALGERGASRRAPRASASRVRRRGTHRGGTPILLVASPVVVVRAPRALRPVTRWRGRADAAVRSRTGQPRAAPRPRRDRLARLPVVVAAVADILPLVPVRHRGTRGRRRAARSSGAVDDSCLH